MRRVFVLILLAFPFALADGSKYVHNGHVGYLLTLYGKPGQQVAVSVYSYTMPADPMRPFPLAKGWGSAHRTAASDMGSIALDYRGMFQDFLYLPVGLVLVITGQSATIKGTLERINFDNYHLRSGEMCMQGSSAKSLGLWCVTQP